MNTLIYAEQRSGQLRRGALELVAATSAAGGNVSALLTGEGAGEAAERLAGYGVNALTATGVPSGNREAVLTALQAAQAETGAGLVLLSCNRAGQTLAPRLAVRLKAAFLEDLLSLEVTDGLVRGTRLSYLSRVVETVETDASPVVVSIKPNVYRQAQAGAGQGTVTALEVELRDEDQRVQAGAAEAAPGGAVSLAEADVVVAGGRGLGSAEAFTELVEPLARELGAAVGSTRAVVDAGWRPFSEQVGQTGKTVAPALYFALGISGAVQHLSGMNRSGVIVSINRDADAPLLKISDYAVIGDVSDVVPALLEAVKELKQEG